MTQIKQYKSIPKGFKLVKRGVIREGDIVKYTHLCKPLVEDCVGLVDSLVKDHFNKYTKIYRRK